MYSNIYKPSSQTENMQLITNFTSNLTAKHYTMASKSAGNVKNSPKKKLLDAIINRTDPEKYKPYSHQTELNDRVIARLRNPCKQREIINFGTPTGSGKTSSIPLLYSALTENHMKDCVLVLTVPSDQNLLRLMPEAIAFGLNFWHFRIIGTEFSIYRPYANRTKVIREKKTQDGAGRQPGKDKSEDGKSKKSDKNIPLEKPKNNDIIEHLLYTVAKSVEENDITPGKCRVIIADVASTHKLFQALNDPDKYDLLPEFLNPHRMVLFFDEPTMGVNNSERVRNRMAEIINWAPRVCILASATLGDWQDLPDWWRGDGKSVYSSITSSPYTQPHVTLGNYNLHYSRLHNILPTTLAPNYHETKRDFAELSMRYQASFMRFFGNDTISQLTGCQPDQTLETLRKDNLLPYLLSHDDVPSITLDKLGQSITKLSKLVAKQGITMFAGLNPNEIAWTLCGYPNPETRHDIIHKAQNLANAAKNAEEKRLKRLDKLINGKRQPDDQELEDLQTPVTVKIGQVSVTAEELDDMDIHSIVFLEHGIAVSANDSDPVIRKIFQETVLTLPDTVLNKSDGRPPVHILCANYDSIYGLDCAGISQVIVCEDLASILQQDDLLQAVGRLRGNGRVIFMSDTTIHKLLGITPSDWDTHFTAKIQSLLLESHSTYKPLDILKQIKHFTPGGITLTPAELAFTVFRSIIQLPVDMYKSILAKWKTTFAECEYETHLQLKYLNSISSIVEPHDNTVYIIMYMYHVFDFDIEIIKKWIINSENTEFKIKVKGILDISEDGSSD